MILRSALGQTRFSWIPVFFTWSSYIFVQVERLFFFLEEIRDKLSLIIQWLRTTTNLSIVRVSRRLESSQPNESLLSNTTIVVTRVLINCVKPNVSRAQSFVIFAIQSRQLPLLIFFYTLNPNYSYLLGFLGEIANFTNKTYISNNNIIFFRHYITTNPR